MFIINDMAPGQEIHDYLIQSLAAFGHHPSIRTQRVGRENLLSLVALNCGITIVSEAMTAAAFPNILYRPIAGEILPFGAVWSDKNENPALRRLLDLAMSMARLHGANSLTLPSETIEPSAAASRIPDRLQ